MQLEIQNFNDWDNKRAQLFKSKESPCLQLPSFFPTEELVYKRNKTVEYQRESRKKYASEIGTDQILGEDEKKFPVPQINVNPQSLQLINTEGPEEDEKETPRAVAAPSILEEEEKKSPAVVAMQIMIDTTLPDDDTIVKRCNKIHQCGHRCNGVEKEKQCLPCLNDGCKDPEDNRLPSQDELCAICYTCELGEQSCVKLGCGHVFHADCVLNLIKHKWNTLRITFAFLSCPSCKQEIKTSSKLIKAELDQMLELRDKVEVIAMEAAKAQGLDLDERLTREGDHYYGDLKGLAMHSCSIYQCFECEKPYFGGMIDCQAEAGLEEKAKKEDLRCKECQLKAYGAGEKNCDKHGSEEIDWKCMFCCSVALWHCFGTHYFCDRCHEEYCTPPYDQVKVRDCGGQNCPLGVPHPKGGPDYKKTAFPLGCGLCRSEKLKKLGENAFIIQEIQLAPYQQKPKKKIILESEQDKALKQRLQNLQNQRNEAQQGIVQRNRQQREQMERVQAAAAARRQVVNQERMAAMAQRHVRIDEQRAQARKAKEAALVQRQKEMEERRQKIEELRKSKQEAIKAKIASVNLRLSQASLQSIKKNEQIKSKAAAQNAQVENKKVRVKTALAESKKLKEAQIEAKLAKIDNIKNDVEARRARLREFNEKAKLIRQSLPQRPQTAKPDDKHDRAFM